RIWQDRHTIDPAEASAGSTFPRRALPNHYSCRAGVIVSIPGEKTTTADLEGSVPRLCQPRVTRANGVQTAQQVTSKVTGIASRSACQLHAGNFPETRRCGPSRDDGNGVDLDELASVAEHRDAEQGARRVVVAEPGAHYAPGCDEVGLVGTRD